MGLYSSQLKFPSLPSEPAPSALNKSVQQAQARSKLVDDSTEQHSWRNRTVTLIFGYLLERYLWKLSKLPCFPHCTAQNQHLPSARAASGSSPCLPCSTRRWGRAAAGPTELPSIRPLPQPLRDRRQVFRDASSPFQSLAMIGPLKKTIWRYEHRLWKAV